MGVKFVGWFPACEEIIYLYEMLILIRTFGRFTRIHLFVLLSTVPKTGIYEDQNGPSFSVQEVIYCSDQ